MPTVIKPKKSETASAVPTTSDLAVGEICVNVADRKIYTRKSNNSIVVVSSHIDTDVGGTSVGGDVTGTVSNIQIGSNTITATELADNSVGITELDVSDGTNGQVLKTNGSGTLSFTTITPGVSESAATAKAVTMAIALG
jgi:carbamoylphosphate synthase large subunit